ncbi:NADH dehydrogenase [ubiquinone] 1 beta subcomplex subunit 11, mitochondrial [Stegastes partitus]|uniref:NADH dehydrogenase [ubiquinone] 1 beta subcomplex subunit 11, mitochondrial n=1 Tax=Stegastes partitus TaxID=144197 RepID=A0A3B4ZBG5_9TELE|nr:PREDICTED: NADH dehydrogenase [ubiquinone] 1 beta subcomplex subunit 11, mitochondrial [Stegastes partitus]
MLTRVSRFGPAFARILSQPPARFVSQSKPSSSAGSAAVTEVHAPAFRSDDEEVSQFDKNPDYHGFSADPVEDEWNMKVGFFLGISVVVVIGGTFLHYLPDHGMRKWARREAEQIIKQREKAGLPVIEENYYDPSKIILPTAEK